MIEVCGYSSNPARLKYESIIARTAAGTTFQEKIFPVTTEVINRSVVVEDGQIKYGQFEGEGEKDYIGAEPEHHGDGELIHHYWGRHLYLTGKHVFIPFSLLIEKQPSLPDVRGVNSAFEARKTS